MDTSKQKHQKGAQSFRNPNAFFFNSNVRSDATQKKPNQEQTYKSFHPTNNNYTKTKLESNSKPFIPTQKTQNAEAFLQSIIPDQSNTQLQGEQEISYMPPQHSQTFFQPPSTQYGYRCPPTMNQDNTESVALSNMFADLNIKNQIRNGGSVQSEEQMQLDIIKDMIFSNMKEQERRDANNEHQDLTELLTVIVFPVGNEENLDNENDRGCEEKPYELKIRKKMNENSLKDIFSRQKHLWEPIFKDYNQSQEQPNFSLYRKPYSSTSRKQGGKNNQSEQLLQILYMKSNNKSLNRNYTALDLELYCQNRFYGPLVVAFNHCRPPYYLDSFEMANLNLIQQINISNQIKNSKDDKVLECLLEAPVLKENLNQIYKTMEALTFYMFRYKSCWCPQQKDSHDSKSCIYAHHMRDFRRPPEIFKYLPEDCEYMQGGTNAQDKDQGWEMCPQGLSCNKCHTKVERLYHPDKYKRINCDRGRCNKSEICAFYHSQQERNHSQKVCKNYRKSVQNKKYNINIKKINQEIKKFYQVDEAIVTPKSPNYNPLLRITPLNYNVLPFEKEQESLMYINKIKIKQNYFVDPDASGQDNQSESSGESQDEVQMEMIHAKEFEQLLMDFKKQSGIDSQNSAIEQGQQPIVNICDLGKTKSASTVQVERASEIIGHNRVKPLSKKEIIEILEKKKISASMKQSRALKRKFGCSEGESSSTDAITSSILSSYDENIGVFETNFMSSINFQTQNQINMNLSELLIQQQIMNRLLEDPKLTPEQRQLYQMQLYQKQNEINNVMQLQYIQQQQIQQQQILQQQQQQQLQQSQDGWNTGAPNPAQPLFPNAMPAQIRQINQNPEQDQIGQMSKNPSSRSGGSKGKTRRLTSEQYVEAFGNNTGHSSQDGRDSYYSQLLFEMPNDMQSPGLTPGVQATGHTPLQSQGDQSKSQSNAASNATQSPQGKKENDTKSPKQKKDGLFVLQAQDSETIKQVCGIDFLDFDDPDLFNKDYEKMRKTSKTFQYGYRTRSRADATDMLMNEANQKQVSANRKFELSNIQEHTNEGGSSLKTLSQLHSNNEQKSDKANQMIAPSQD